MRWRALLALAACLALLGACDRRPRFVPAGAESTAALAADSVALVVQQARERWEAPGAGGDAAALTARLVHADLAAHEAEPIPSRARSFLDSLGLGAEIAGAADVAAANFFAPADPAGGSWPYLYWRDDAGTHLQGIEGGGQRLLELATDGAAAAAAARVAILFARPGARVQPMAIVWQRPAGKGVWSMIQTLGADSLGGVGTARFLPPGDDDAVLVARTHRGNPRFDECASCPHVYRTRRFRWGVNGLETVSDQVEPSAYASFVRLIAALASNDRDGALALVVDPSLVEAAEGYEWGRAKGLWRVAPGSGASDEEMTFLRGNDEAFRVHFAQREGGWLISGFEPTSRTID